MSNVTASSMSNISQAQVANQVDYKVARKVLDVAEQQGDAVVSMLQESAQLQGELHRVDGHKGQLLDTTA